MGHLKTKFTSRHPKSNLLSNFASALPLQINNSTRSFLPPYQYELYIMEKNNTFSIAIEQISIYKKNIQILTNLKKQLICKLLSCPLMRRISAKRSQKSKATVPRL